MGYHKYIGVWYYRYSINCTILLEVTHEVGCSANDNADADKK